MAKTIESTFAKTVTMETMVEKMNDTIGRYEIHFDVHVFHIEKISKRSCRDCDNLLRWRITRECRGSHHSP